MKYDITYSENGVEYGVKSGSDTAVFLKTGKGAAIFGESEEQPTLYQELTEKIFSAFGYTVFVANNPLECEESDPLNRDLKIFNRLLPSARRIVYVGYSSGANYGAWLGADIYEIKKMLLLNPILNMNFQKLKRTCELFDDKKITVVLGENDPSSKYSFMIPRRGNVQTVVLQGQSHKIEREVFFQTVMDFLSEK